MAKAAEGIHFTGTIGNICFYQWGDRTFARTKSSLTRDRVLKSKEFTATRKHAGDMGRASRLASEIYKALPGDIKGRWIFRAIAGHAASLLYKGKSEQEVKDILLKKYVLAIYDDNKKRINTKDKTTGNIGGLQMAPSTKQANRQFHDIFLQQWEQQGKPAQFFNRAWKRGSTFNPETIPRRSEYFLGLKHASRLN
jgi:hypothetical protein